MKFALFLLLLPLLLSAEEPPQMTADRLTRIAGEVRGSGHVKIRIASLLLEGDQGTIKPETEAVEVAGRATATLPAREDRTVLRYGAGVLVTGQAINVAADRIEVKYRLLRGRGHVDVHSDKGRLQSDEIDVFLNIGDADLRGNVRLNGYLPATPARTFRDRLNRFPPEIVK